MKKWKCYSLSCVQLSATPWTPPPMGFSRQEYWSGLHSLLQGIFLTQGSNLGLLHCRQIFFLPSEPTGKPSIYMSGKKIQAEKNYIHSSVFKLKSWNSSLWIQVLLKAGDRKRFKPTGFIGENGCVKENSKAVTWGWESHQAAKQAWPQVKRGR